MHPISHRLPLATLLTLVATATALAQPPAPCGPGFYSATGFAPCRPCPAGTYNPQTGQMQCASCPVGTYVASAAQAQCIICPAGTFRGQTGGQSCQPCPAGTFGPNFGMTSCVTCPTGLTNTATAAISCLPCPVGFFFSEATRSCQPCPFGADCSLPGNLCPTELAWNEEGGGTGPGGTILPSCQPACPGGPPVIVLAPAAVIKAWTDEIIDIVVQVYSASEAGPPTFYWRHNGVTMTSEWRILGEASPHLTITRANASDAGEYDLVVSNACGWVTSTTAHVQVHCKADFNRSGAVSVQDLFDFLAAYFSGVITADLNHTYTLTVQDLFDYLTAYFSPCV